MTDFQITLNPTGPSPVMALMGEADISVTDAVVAHGITCLHEASSNSLILDLAQLTFIDAATLGALVELRTTAERLGRQLTIRRPNARALRLLQITNLTSSFTVES